MMRLKKIRGFTLIELMIVVSIIAILAAGAATGFGSSLLEGKASDLTEDLVRIGRVARFRSVGRGSAHRLVYSRSPDNGLGVLQLDEGDRNLCNLVTAWSAIEAVNAIDFTTGSPDTPPPTGAQLVDFSPVDTSLQTVQLCFEPTGVTLIRDTAAVRFTEGVFVGGANIYDVVFQVSRSRAGVAQGVVRFVRFPQGGSARIQR